MSRLLALLLPLAVAACATPPEPAPQPPAPPVVETPPAPPPPEDASSKQGAQSLTQGVQAYENGQYKVARKSLTAALDSGLSKADQVMANKTLAFIACASGQRVACKGYFRKALEIDPAFTLSKTEAGHPMWGKAFREVKAEKPRKN